MSMYKSMKRTFIDEYKNRSDIYKGHIVQWRAEAPIHRIPKPTNIARARELGYKAKDGVITVRVRVRSGKRKRPAPAGGRKPSKNGRFYSVDKSIQSIAEERAARKFSNCEVLNSYFIGKSGSEKFYEVMLLDRTRPSVASDSAYKKIVSHHNRVFRGLTASGKRHRGLASKGFGVTKQRSSKRKRLRS